MCYASGAEGLSSSIEGNLKDIESVGSSNQVNCVCQYASRKHNEPALRFRMNSSQNLYLPLLAKSIESTSMKFAELSDDQWEFMKPHIPPQPSVGRKRADDRKTINGILYVLNTGCRWHDMPQCYGAYQTAWRRLKWWSREGVWDTLLTAFSGTRLCDRETYPRDHCR